MHWAKVITRLCHERLPAVLVTVAVVRGHAPRSAGAKMVVTSTQAFGTIGGGNLEETATVRARRMIDQLTAGVTVRAQQLEMSLSAHADSEFGVQCCGGDVTLMLEPLPCPPAVAVFGMGHVGRELARILARHEIELHLADSRAEQVDSSLEAQLAGATAEVSLHHTPVPEVLLADLPRGTHVVIMSHDHAEDAALCDSALRTDGLGTIGLIGSSAKWRRFEKVLAEQGHSPQQIGRIRCPVGIGQITAKEPAAIAVGIAAQLLVAFAAEHNQERPTR